MQRIFLALIFALCSVPAFAQVSVIVTPSGATAFPIVIPASAVNGAGVMNTNLTFGTDNTYDIGASGASRPRNVFLAGSAVVVGAVEAGTLTADTKFGFGAGGVLWVSATAPTISSGFGTSPSIVNSNGTAAFTLNVGTGGVATSGVIGLPTATTGWNCWVIDRTNNTVTRETATTTTTATLTAAAAWAASDILQVSCFAI